MHHQSLELDLSNGPGDEGSAFYSMHENEIDYSDHAAPLSIAEDGGVLMMPPAQHRRHSNGRDGVSGGSPSDPPVDPELAKLTEMTEDSQTHESGEPVGVESLDTEMNEEGGECEEVDHRSIYVGNVDYGATPQELQDHFKTCGTVNRVTIMVDKFSGHPKGYAYIEFADAEAVSNAVVLDDTTFRGRQIKVKSKRTNIPGFNSMRGRGRGFRGRGRGRGFGRGYMRGPFMGYGPRFRGRGAKRGVAPY